jgi:uncharacterized damage-inducible protein DinB
MRNTYYFDVMEVMHGRLIDLAQTCPEDKRDTIPAGFNNNVRWHLGHVLAGTDAVLHVFTDKEFMLPEAYRKSYSNGTKPADWNSETPDWDAIIANLRELPGKLRAKFEGKLDQELPENFAQAKTLDEMLLYMIGHINLHMGQIAAMIRILKQ